MAPTKSKHGDPMTDRQAEIHAFMVEHQKANGFPAPIRAVQEAFGMASPNGVMSHMRGLKAKGRVRFVEYGPNKHHHVAVDPTRPDACPCCGRAAAEGGAA